MSVEIAPRRRGPAKNPSPMPDDFAQQCIHLDCKQLEIHYRVGNDKINRWMRLVPIHILIERQKAMRERRKKGQAYRITREHGLDSEIGWAAMCKRGDAMMRAAMAKFYANLGERAA